MAKLKQITRSNPLSAYTQATPGAGMAAIFGALADTMQYGIDYYMPGAIEEMQQRGAESGQGAAGAGSAPTGGLSGDIGLYGDAIASIESKGSGDYSAVGPVTRSGDRAYGRYQVMGANIPQWTKMHLGREMTPQEFLSDETAQDAVFKGQFGNYVEKYGNPQDAASVWFTGKPLSEGGGRSDGYITGNQYVDKFTAYVKDNPAAAFTDEPGGVAVRGVYDRMLADAPESVRNAVAVNNDYRSPEQQAQIIASNWGKFDLNPEGKAKWLADVESMGAVAAGDKWEPVFSAAKRTASDGAGTPFRNWIALPGRSQHQKGNAADLTFSSKEARQWFHENAGNYGAAFPLSNEPWHMEVAGARGGDAGSRGGPPAVATDAAGRTEPKIYSPYSGPLLRAYNAAAQAAYSAETLNKASIDFQAMRNNFMLDPAGFAQASKAYVDEIVSQSPAQFRRGLRESLNGTAARHEASIMSAQQADTRQRAVNSTTALSDRLSTEYSELLAAGDAEGALAASMELQEVLRAKESIPGAGWTREQSENVMINARRAADGIIERNATKARTETNATLQTIIDAAKNGMTASDEGILQDPAVWNVSPDKAAEAQAFVTLRDSFPEMFKLPPAITTQVAETLKQTPVDDKFEVDVANAADKAARANATAWEEDPIKRAAEVLDTKPTPMPEYVPGGEQAFVEWLKSRKDYGYTLRDGGYTDVPVFMTNEETKQFSKLLSKDMDPVVRGTMAGVIVAGLGQDAVGLFDSLKVDNVTRYAGKMMAIGGDQATALMALQGQAMMAEKLVEVPDEKEFNQTMRAEMTEAFSGLPEAVNIQAEVLDYAMAIYAAQAQGVDPKSTAAAKLQEQSLQMALGQSQNSRGKTTGGIQEVMGFNTMTPLGVTSEQITRSFHRAIPGMGFDAARDGGPLGAVVGAIEGMGQAVFGAVTGAEEDQPPEYNEEIWTDAAGSLPMFNGKPLDPDLFGGKSVRLVWDGGDFYRMEIITGGGALDIMDAQGNVMMLNLKRMIEAAQ